MTRDPAATAANLIAKTESHINDPDADIIMFKR
jgi:hypothetical protein